MDLREKLTRLIEIWKLVVCTCRPAAISPCMTGPNKDRTQARITRCLEIRRGIADEPGMREVDEKFLRRLFDQCDARFSTLASNLELGTLSRKSAVWMMGAMIKRIEISALIA